jgi:diguanylate cyclase (GGDEF)-like protein
MGYSYSRRIQSEPVYIGALPRDILIPETAAVKKDMHLSQSLNYLLGSWIVLVLIYADYTRKFNTDNYQRTLFFHVLVCAMAALGCEFIYYLFVGIPGRGLYYLFYITNSIYYISLIFSLYSIMIFIDYMAFRDLRRARRLETCSLAVSSVHFILLVLNLKFRFYFIITPENILSHGSLYFLNIIFSYGSILFVVYDIITGYKVYKKFILVFTIFLLLISIGSAIDQILGTSTLIWPCYTAAMLYAYFFIARTDSTIDSLTGIGNRYAFNEFIDKLSRQIDRNAWFVVMIDMDHFKEINDTLGHAEGDNALRDMAAIIKGCIRHSDFAARYGGDEFIVAAPVEYDINRLMERIQNAMDSQNSKRTRPYQLEMSYGCDVYTPGGEVSIHEFMNRVDSLMYKQKEEHRRAGKRGS